MYRIEFDPINKVVRKIQQVEAPESFIRTPGVIYAESEDIDALGLKASRVDSGDPLARNSENYWTELITKDNIGDYISNTVVDLEKKFLKKTEEDTAQKIIHFTEGIRSSGDVRSEEYLFKTKGYKIDKEGNGDMKSLILREFLEVPEIRFNRITVVGGEFWLTDGAIILTVAQVPNVSNGYSITFKLEDNETQPFHVGDLIKGIHQEFDDSGNYQGFYTIWMEVVTVTGKNYIEVKVKPQYTGTIKPPIKFLNVARVGNVDPSKESRQRSIYMSSTEGSITFLDGVNKWDVEPYMIKMCLGNIDKLGDIPGVPQLTGYSAYLKNLISYGKHFEIDEQGNPVPTPIYKGPWNSKIKYCYYDQVTHVGCLWLCTNREGSVVGDAPDAFDPNWSVVVGKGDSYQEFYKVSDAITSIPSVPQPTDQYQLDTYIPSGWSKTQIGVSLANKYEWVISRYGREGNWSTLTSPAVYAVYGVDGDTDHFIYKRTTTESAPSVPGSDFAQNGWTEDPVGVNEYNRYEWTSVRHRINEVWGNFSNPAVWARYSHDGEPGKDGKDVEFIFKQTTTPDKPATPVGTNVDDSVPQGWTDDSKGVDSVNICEWTCRRIKVDGAWSTYNTPALWAKYSFDGSDGKDGKDLEYVYKLNANETPPNTPPTSQVDDYIPDGWSDDPVGVSPTLPYEFVSKRTRVAGVWGAYSAPKLWAKYSYDGENGISPTVYNIIPSITTVTINKTGNTTPSSILFTCKKTYQETTTTSAELYLVAQRSVDGGTYTLFGSIAQVNSISITTGAAYKTYRVRGYVSQSDATAMNDKYICECTINSITDGTDATFPYTLDLLNDNTSVVCDNNYTNPVLGGANAQTVALLYLGETQISSGVTYKVDAQNNGTFTVTGNTIKVASITSGSKSVTADIGAYVNNTKVASATFTVTLVAKGPNGEDAILYSLLPTPTIIRQGPTGIYTPTQVSCIVNKVIGNSAATETAEKLVKYQFSNGTVTAYTRGSNVSIPSGAAWLDWFLYDGSTLLDKERVSVVADGQPGRPGDNGEPGSILRTRGAFKQGESYYYNRVFRDVVYHIFNSVKILFMVRSYSESAVTAAPTSAEGDSNWQKIDDYKAIATELLLADKADIAGFKFYKDKLISQWGTLNGVATTVDELTAAQWDQFKPNLSLNGQTGNVNIVGLQSNILKTADQGARIEIEGTEIKVFGLTAMNILFGVDEAGMAVLKYYDNNGKFLYDLGPSGIRWHSQVVETWESFNYDLLCSATITDPTWMDVKGIKDNTCIKTVTCHRFQSTAGGDATRYLYTAKSIDSPKIEDGWFRLSNSVAQNYPASNTNEFITPFGEDSTNGGNAIYYMDQGGVRDRNPIKYGNIVLVKGGLIIENRIVCWNG